MAYASDASGRDEVYLQAFPPTSARWTISTSGGSAADCRGDGRELYYVSVDGQFMAVEMKTRSGAVEAGPPRALFPLRPSATIAPGFGDYPYAAAPDGQRFLVNLHMPERDRAPMVVTLNWAADLKR